MPTALRRGSAFAARLEAALFAAPLLLGAMLLVASPARADEDEGRDEQGDDAIAADKNAKGEKGDKMPGEKEKEKTAPAPDGPDPKYDPLEEQGKRYNFVGLRFRDVIVPKFMINWFADGGATVNVAMFGPEFSTRKNGTEIDFAVQYADYSMNRLIFKGNSEPDEAYEAVSSSMKMLLFTADLLFDIPIDKTGKFTFLIGGGIGFGVVFGDLNRAQVYPAGGRNSADPNDQSQWSTCTGPAQKPTEPGQKWYCDDDKGNNQRFGDYTEPSWANGGSKPNIFPWLSLPQLSFRYKPIKQLQTRFDTGFSTSGFFFGLSAGYGL
ncbi:MAG: hypothetical protein ACMG6S_10875 [Byssovorax sp.]